MPTSTPDLPVLPEDLLARCQELTDREAFAGFLAELRRLAEGFEPDLLDRRIADAAPGPETGPALLLRAACSPPPDLARLLEILDDHSGPLAPFAALCLVQHFPDDDRFATEVLLGADVFSAPRLRRNAHDYVFHWMGLSGDRRFLPWLTTALCDRFHFCLLGPVRDALARFDALPDSATVPYARSISVMDAGMEIFISDDPKFTGSSQCIHCRYFPCRINRYHYGAIEDCKLWNRTPPDDRLEIRDHRSWRAPVPPVLRGPLPADEVAQAREDIAASQFVAALARLVVVLAEDGDAVPGAWADMAGCLTALGDDELAAEARSARTVPTKRRPTLCLAGCLLGWQLEEQGDHAAAATAFRAAIPLADEADDKVDCAVRAASALAKGGDLQGAYRLLLLLEGEAVKAEDPDCQADWVEIFSELHRRLGGQEEPYSLRAIRAKLPAGRRPPAGDAPETWLAAVERRLDLWRQAGDAEAMAPLTELLDQLVEKYDEALSSQPGGPARRQVRDAHQRVFEAALLALLAHVESAGLASDSAQSLLSRAWSLVLKCRNPELQGESTPLPPEQLRHLHGLEDSFHRALHSELTGRSGPIWHSFYERLTAYEISTLRTERGAVPQTLTPPEHGVALAFFQFRDLIATQPLLALTAHEGRFRAHWIADAATRVLSPLARWTRFIDGTPDPSRALRARRHSRPAAQRATAVEPAVVQAAAQGLFPETLPGLGESSPAVPWYLYADAALHAVPLEILPGTGGGLLGRNLAIRFCLRPVATAECELPIDFRRGWLGLGGAPALADARADYLAGTLEEVTLLERTLAARGCPTEILVGEDAHFDRLLERLTARRPAVLHLAVHGHFEPRVPDACFLILAMAPGAAELELVPFRRIRDLPLAGVQLVVLSACSSLLGPTDKSGGTQGMAWAFLQAGATQVLASRYPVSDNATCRLMQILYRHLEAHPAAEALRRMREDGEREGIALREIGAWALWS